MEKILKRAARAARVKEGQRARKKLSKEKTERFQRKFERTQHRRRERELILTERANRKLDWEAGPLAPRRDVGELAKHYATLSVYEYGVPDRKPQDRPKWLHIAEGDRVVLLRGRDRGKIGQVRETNQEKGTVQIHGLNMADLKLPEWMMAEQEEQGRDVLAVPTSVPIEDVRLVYALPDDKTGVPRDVVIDRVISMNRKWDKVKKEWDEGDRVIPGTNTIIPWPETADEDPEEYDNDTPKHMVDQNTFTPLLLRPPMPLSVIDELRNKYSRFRTRHDWDYVAKKEAEEERAGRRKELMKTMQTPLEALAELRAKQKEAQQQELSQEQLAKIGEVIAQEQARKGGSVAEKTVL